MGEKNTSTCVHEEHTNVQANMAIVAYIHLNNNLHNMIKGDLTRRVISSFTQPVKLHTAQWDTFYTNAFFKNQWHLVPSIYFDKSFLSQNKLIVGWIGCLGRSSCQFQLILQALPFSTESTYSIPCCLPERLILVSWWCQFSPITKKPTLN